jgi:1,4-dihydroxy-2-naphthoyl-CoA synthase
VEGKNAFVEKRKADFMKFRKKWGRYGN